MRGLSGLVTDGLVAYNSGDEDDYVARLPDGWRVLSRKTVREQLPVRLRKRLSDEPDEGTRSDQVFEFAQSLKDRGVEEVLALNALMIYPPAQEAYEGRLEVEVLRAYYKPGTRRGNGGGKGGRGGGEEGQAKILFDKLGDLKAENVEWLWDQYIPLRALTIVAGRQGMGKSQWSAFLAGQVTKGVYCDPGAVLYVSLEDSTTQTITPRLHAVGAKPNMTYIFKGVKRQPEDEYLDGLSLPRDSQLIADIATQKKVKLVVIDPLSAVLGEGKNYDSHRESDVRRALAPITAAADRAGFALVAIMHLRKQKDVDDPMNSILGSIATAAAARSILMFNAPGKDSTMQESDRILVHVKSNLGELQPSRHLRLHTTAVVVKSLRVKTSFIRDLGIAWEGAEHTEIVHKSGSKLEEAVAFLLDRLAEGKCEAREVQGDAAFNGISDITLRRARKKLRVRVHNAKGPKTRAFWSLPQNSGT